MGFKDYPFNSTPIAVVECVEAKYSINTVNEVSNSEIKTDFFSVVSNALKQSISTIENARKKAHTAYPKLFS